MTIYAITVNCLYVRSMMALFLIFLTVHMRAVLEAVEVEVEVKTASGGEASRRTANGSGAC